MITSTSLKERSLTYFIKNILFLTLPSLLFLLLLLEIFFRFVIPAAEIPFCFFDPQDQILKYDRGKADEGIYSMGKLAQKRARWRINNAGWNSDIDYEEQRTRPLIAVIGDSYVEALQIDPKSNYPSLLRSDLKDRYDVYSFGISGASLCQYLQISRYVDKHFHPDIIIFNVVHNDFLESLCSFKPNPGWLCIEEEGSLAKECLIKPHRPSTMKRMLWRSSIVRYAALNLKLKNLDIFRTKKRAYEANVSVDLYEQNEERIKIATDYILKTLRSENMDRKMIFLIDAPRKDIYEDRLSRSRVLWLNKMLEEKCRENGFSFIDMTDIFRENYGQHQKRFESDLDFHWNEWGHSVVAEAVRERLKENGIL